MQPPVVCLGVDNSLPQQLPRSPSPEALHHEQGPARPTPELCRLVQPPYGGNRRIYAASTDTEARERAVQSYHSYHSHFAKPSPGGSATRARVTDTPPMVRGCGLTRF